MKLIPLSTMTYGRSMELNNTSANRTQFLESERERHAQGWDVGKNNQSKKKLPLPNNFTVTYICPYLDMLTRAVSTSVFYSEISTTQTIFTFTDIYWDSMFPVHPFEVKSFFYLRRWAERSCQAPVRRQPPSTLPGAQLDSARISWKADDGHRNVQVINSRFEGSSDILFSSH